MTDTSKENGFKGEILKMTADVVAAYVGNNSLTTGAVSDVINTVYGSLHNIDQDLESSSVVSEPMERGPARPLLGLHGCVCRSAPVSRGGGDFVNPSSSDVRISAAGLQRDLDANGFASSWSRSGFRTICARGRIVS